MPGNTLPPQPAPMPDDEPQFQHHEVPAETAQGVGHVATGLWLYRVADNVYSPDGRQLILL